VDGILDIEHTPEVDVLILRGEHDLSTQTSLQGRIDQALDAGKSVVVDLSAAEFIDSTVLAAILHGQRRAADGYDGRGLAIVAPPGAAFVTRMLSLVHIDDQVEVHRSRDSAVASLQRAAHPQDGIAS
jgi:anti-sigma B factor antagonist